MSNSSNNEKFSNLAERAKHLATSSVLPKTRASYNSYWNQFALLSSENSLQNQSKITDESPNHIALYIITQFNEGKSTADTCDNIRSWIRSYYKRIIKVLDE